MFFSEYQNMFNCVVLSVILYTCFEKSCLLINILKRIPSQCHWSMRFTTFNILIYFSRNNKLTRNFMICFPLNLATRMFSSINCDCVVTLSSLTSENPYTFLYNKAINDTKPRFEGKRFTWNRYRLQIMYNTHSYFVNIVKANSNELNIIRCLVIMSVVGK